LAAVYPSRRSLLAGALTLAAAPARSAPYPWPDGARGAVSLTYDDGLDSQLTNAVPALQAARLKGTFFLVQENMEARLADWQKVARLGHEIGDHTETHPCLLGSFNAASFERRQIAPMEQFLNRNFGRQTGRVFAYPCGFLGLGHGSASLRDGRYDEVVARDFSAARTVDGPPIDPAQAKRDRLHLAGFEPTYDADDPGPGFAYLQTAMDQGRWAILVFHEVLPARVGEGDTSIAVHGRILDFIKRQPLWCAPMGEVFRHVAGVHVA
jgi:peptidoglycan/xylan/chitin deacetylase (PgdA/CDA1 family)